MEPGRQLDVLVAEKVMGWTYGSTHLELDPPSGGIHHLSKMPPYYSTDISAAWEIVKRLTIQEDTGYGPEFELMYLEENTDRMGWQARFHDRYNVMPLFYKTTNKFWYSYGVSAPHAICLAALKAVGVEI